MKQILVAFVATISANFAFAQPAVTGPQVLADAAKAFPVGVQTGQIDGTACSLQVTQTAGGASLTVVVTNQTKTGRVSTSCTLRASDPNLREDLISNTDGTTTIYGNSNYTEGGPTTNAVGCRFGRTGNTVLMVDFSAGMTLCELDK